MIDILIIQYKKSSTTNMAILKDMTYWREKLKVDKKQEVDSDRRGNII